jgi:pimeloyl-ACP methyl ester carboxylesterase
MGGEYSGSFLPDHCRLVAENVTASIIKGAGHWLVQENTEQVQRDLLAFLLAK